MTIEGAQSHRVAEGCGTLAVRMAADLHSRGVEIRLNTAVAACEHSNAGATLVTASGERVKATRVVLALPPTQCAKVEFTSSLSTERVAAWEALRMGQVLKVVAEYEEKWWDGATEAIADPDLGFGAAFVCDVSHSSSRHVLAIFFHGDQAAKWSGADQAAARVLEALRCAQKLMSHTGEDPRALAPLGVVEGDWIACPTIGGGYNTVPATLGSLVKHKSFCGPKGNESCLHFASSDIAEGWTGYMDGAIQAGEKAAVDILAAARACANV